MFIYGFTNSYGKKKDDEELRILERVKDYSKLLIGNKYHLRKFVSKDGSTVYDEVYDIVLKEFLDGYVIDSETDEKFQVG